jgi:tripartite-type tricarboxylate transporter receptor subunit TctC
MKRVSLAAAMTVALVGMLTPAAAQNFPNRPIKILVGFPAGGPSDVPARVIADKLQKSLGQSVVVENKTGAAGMIAMN